MRLAFLIGFAVLARLAAAQASSSASPLPRATVTGVVFDSLSGTPVAGAVVQLVDATEVGRFASTTLSDSLGRFTHVGVPNGRYTLGFFHPTLDSLGLEPPVREVRVQDNKSMRVDLAIPSPARLRASLCGAPSAVSPGGVVVGVVHDARDGVALAGVAVIAEWIDLSLTAGQIVQSVSRAAATTGGNGWFALCNVPNPGTTVLAASRGADSTDRVDVNVAAAFLRRDLYLGPARMVDAGDTTQTTDSVARAPRRRRSGDGRVSGTVVTADGRPLEGAQVSISDGPRTRANARGEWTLTDAPLGTRMLQIRAVNHYPVSRELDVVEVGTQPVRVALLTLKAVLDTVMVNARSLNVRAATGFEERRRSGVGRFLTAADIARRPFHAASDIFRTVSGITMEPHLKIRGPFGECTPALYINGKYVPPPPTGILPDDIDMFMNPDEITGIEVYFGFVPAQFQQALSGCGSIAIWLK